MRLRLIEAAFHEDVAELERLRELDIATRDDYRVALDCAVNHGSVAAAMYLWTNLEGFPIGEDDEVLGSLPTNTRRMYDHYRTPELDFDVAQTNTDFAKLVLQAAESKWTLQLARQAPEWLIDILDIVSEDLSTKHAVHTNLLHLVRYNRRTPRSLPGGDNVHARLLMHSLFAACSSSHHPWQGIHSHVRELCADGEVFFDKDLSAVLGAVDRHPGVEECTTLDFLIQCWGDRLDMDSLLESCCKSTKTGVPMRFLLDRITIEDEEGFYASLASLAADEGSCETIEACLDRASTVDTELSDSLLLNMAHNRATATGSRALAHVLEHLFQYASLEGVQQALRACPEFKGQQRYRFFPFRPECENSTPAHAMRLVLFEHNALRTGFWSYDVLFKLSQSDFFWMLQRNPTTLVPNLALLSQQPLPGDLKPLPQNAWVTTFLAQQASFRSVLLAHTPLAADLVELVLQYT
jgi:hypothetical protein